MWPEEYKPHSEYVYVVTLITDNAVFCTRTARSATGAVVAAFSMLSATDHVYMGTNWITRDLAKHILELFGDDALRLSEEAAGGVAVQIQYSCVGD